MKQQISALIYPVEGRISAHLILGEDQISTHLTPIDNQSQYAQASAQIVRKNKCTNIKFSTRYISRPKEKKVYAPKPGQQAFLPSCYIRYIPSMPPIEMKKNAGIMPAFYIALRSPLALTLVVRPGFEPRQTESESVVLPLHNRT